MRFPSRIALQPRDLGLILGYRCQAACAHCLYNCGPGWGDWITPEAVRETDGGAPAVVADVVGGGMFAPLFESLAPGGRFVTAGAIAGASVTLNLRQLYLPHRELIGSTMGTPRRSLPNWWI